MRQIESNINFNLGASLLWYLLFEGLNMKPLTFKISMLHSFNRMYILYDRAISYFSDDRKIIVFYSSTLSRRLYFKYKK